MNGFIEHLRLQCFMHMFHPLSQVHYIIIIFSPKCETAEPQMSVPLSKHQSRLGLGVVVAGRRAADEHGGAAVPAQGVLQDARHLAVTVRDVSFLQGERHGR